MCCVSYDESFPTLPCTVAKETDLVIPKAWLGDTVRLELRGGGIMHLMITSIDLDVYESAWHYRYRLKPIWSNYLTDEELEDMKIERA